MLRFLIAVFTSSPPPFHFQKTNQIILTSHVNDHPSINEALSNKHVYLMVILNRSRYCYGYYFFHKESLKNEQYIKIRIYRCSFSKLNCRIFLRLQNNDSNYGFHHFKRWLWSWLETEKTSYLIISHVESLCSS